jgi:ADP-ribose pyrophosphatase YjhB (NUDIX family)
MSNATPPHWLSWAREIQALAQTGDHYAVNEYQHERYHRLAQIAAEMISHSAEMDCPPLADAFHAQVGYATPRVDVRAAIFQGERLLLVQERSDGGWTLPGGWADVGDVPSQAAEREAWEEAGVKVKACRVIGVYDANRTGPLEIFHAYKIVFLCDYIAGEPRPSLETAAAAFFSLAEIPSALSGERTLPRHIRDAYAALTDPALPTVFD